MEGSASAKHRDLQGQTYPRLSGIRTSASFTSSVFFRLGLGSESSRKETRLDHERPARIDKYRLHSIGNHRRALRWYCCDDYGASRWSSSDRSRHEDEFEGYGVQNRRHTSTECKRLVAFLSCSSVSVRIDFDRFFDCFESTSRKRRRSWTSEQVVQFYRAWCFPGPARTRTSPATRTGRVQQLDLLARMIRPRRDK